MGSSTCTYTEVDAIECRSCFLLCNARVIGIQTSGPTAFDAPVPPQLRRFYDERLRRERFCALSAPLEPSDDCRRGRRRAPAARRVGAGAADSDATDDAALANAISSDVTVAAAVLPPRGRRVRLPRRL